MTVRYALLATPIIQYDGTNGVEVIAAMNNFNYNTVVTDSTEIDNVLTISADGNGGLVNGGWSGSTTGTIGDWFTPVNGWVQCIPETEFAQKWLLVP